MTATTRLTPKELISLGYSDQRAPAPSEIILMSDGGLMTASIIHHVTVKRLIHNRALTAHELVLSDLYSMICEIPSTGFHSVFYQIFDRDRLDELVDELEAMNASEQASALRESIDLYFHGRSDIRTIQQKIDEDFDDFSLSEDESQRLHDLGEVIYGERQTPHWTEVCFPPFFRRNYEHFVL
jgi:hypothetical protein